MKPPSHESRAEAVALFERALALDHESVAAQSWLAIELAARVLDFMTGTAAADVVRAEGLIIVGHRRTAGNSEPPDA